MPNVPRPDAPDTYLSQQVAIEEREITQKLNGNLSLGRGEHTERTGNINGQWIRHNFPSVANTETTIYHGLGRIPIGYQVWDVDQAVSIYTSRRGSWTDQVMYLKSDGKGFSVLLMVI